MWFTPLQRWFQEKFQSATHSRTPRRGRPAARPALEILEDRNLLSGVIPNDPRFPEQWALHNTGQLAQGIRGKPGADIHTPEAWNVITGSTKVPVAVLDTGVDYNHPDLYKNIWVNQAEIPDQWLAGFNLDRVVHKSDVNDVDGDGLLTFWDLNDAANAGLVNDSNGDGRIDAGDLLRPIAQGGWESGSTRDGDTQHPDDFFGWDFVKNTNDPMARLYHGTFVAGIIGAMGDNGVGVTGIEWRTQIVPLQVDSLTGNEPRLAAFDYAVKHAIPICNFSESAALPEQRTYDALARLRDAGVLLVGSANNDGWNDDFRYPTYANLDNILVVGATNNRDFKPSFSQSSVNKVDLGAPGLSILSTRPNGAYGFQSGTSFAAPYVAGTAALVKALHPDWNYHQVIHQILATTDVPLTTQSRFFPVGGERYIRSSFASGRLNAAGAVGPVAGGYLTGTGTHDQFLVRAAADNPNRIEVLLNGAVVFSDLSEHLIGGLTIEGRGGDETLTVDDSQGDPMPYGGIRFDGGPGHNHLVLTGGAGLGRARYTANGPGNGLLDDLEFRDAPFSFSPRAGFVKFNDVADVALDIPTGQLSILNETPMGSQETLTDAGVAGRTVIAFNGGLAPMTFVNPTNQLEIDTANLFPGFLTPRGFGPDFPGNVNSTTTTIASLGSGFNAAINVRASSAILQSPGFGHDIEFGQDTVNVAADLNLGSALSDGHLHIEATDIHVTGRITTLTGAVSLVADRSITLAPGAAITTRDGDLTLQGNPAIPDVLPDPNDPSTFLRFDVVSDGNFVGLDINGATLKTTGKGNLVLQGRGGNDAGTGGHFGIWVHNGARIVSTGTQTDAGAISLDGTGGSGTDSDHGVLIAGKHTRVTSQAGAIRLTGATGDTGSEGVVLAGKARVTAHHAAALTVTGASLLVDKGSRLTTEQGALAVTTTGAVTIRGSVRADGNSFAVTAGGGVLVTATGLLSGSGTVSGNLTNAGRLQPGSDHRFGAITITGDFRQTATGILFIDLGAATAGHFDQLIVSGTATLGGRLAVHTSRRDGFRKESGASYPVLTFGARGLDDHGLPSDFDTVTGLDLSGKHVLERVFDATSMDLVVRRRHREGRDR